MENFVIVRLVGVEYWMDHFTVKLVSQICTRLDTGRNILDYWNLSTTEISASRMLSWFKNDLLHSKIALI
jgi:hypothetical protein